MKNNIISWIGFTLGVINFALLFWRDRVHLKLTSSIICRKIIVPGGDGDYFTWNVANLSNFDVYILDVGFSSYKFPFLAKLFGEFISISISDNAEIKVLGRSKNKQNVPAVFPIKLESRSSIILATSDIMKIADAHDTGCRYMYVSTACGHFHAVKVRAFEPEKRLG